MPSNVVFVIPPVPNAAYDPSTLIGQVRLHCADTDVENAVFSDAEIRYFLVVGQNDACFAASFALEALAADEARIGNEIKIGRFTENPKTVAETLAARAATLRSLANVSAAILSPDRVFSTDSNAGQTLGTMSGW